MRPHSGVLFFLKIVLDTWPYLGQNWAKLEDRPSKYWKDDWKETMENTQLPQVYVVIDTQGTPVGFYDTIKDAAICVDTLLKSHPYKCRVWCRHSTGTITYVPVKGDAELIDNDWKRAFLDISDRIGGFDQDRDSVKYARLLWECGLNPEEIYEFFKDEVPYRVVRKMRMLIGMKR